MKHLRKAALGIATLSLILAACGGDETSASDNSSENDAGPTIGLVTNQGNYYFQSIQSTLEELAAADGGQILAVNTNSDAAAEAQAIQNFIERQVDVILVSVQHPDGSLASIRNAVDAGIPVVCYNTCLGDEDAAELVEGFIKSDDYDLGRQTGDFAADYIGEQFGGTARIALLNCDPHQVCVDRKAGFKDALEGLDVEYVADQEGYLADEAATVTQDIITASPEVQAFWAVNEGGTAGAWAGISASGGEQVVFGTDMSPEIGGHMVSGDGIIVATTAQDGTSLANRTYDVVKAVRAGETVTPFVQEAPGYLFSINDLPAIEEYLASSGE